MFTVILCTYNGAKFLNTVIPTILNQNEYDRLVNKFIIVDNNSTDNTREIIENYITNTNKMEYLFQEKQGLAYAREMGIKNAVGDWIVFIDDDNELFDNWLVYAEEYININNNIGIFNGCSIPKINFKMSAEQEAILKNTYTSLACTHLDIKDVKYDNISPVGTVFGAGMVLKRKDIQEFINNIGFTRIGRTGNNLESGEDGDMRDYILSKGHKEGFCSNMIIHHIIPPNRLEKDYALRLIKGISSACYKGQSKQSLYVLRRIKNTGIALKDIVRYAIYKNRYKDDLEQFVKWELIYFKSKLYISMVLKDKWFLR